MFMTAGSCSVMLLWPTRRTFCCQGKVAGFCGARRGGRATRLGVGSFAGVCAAARVLRDEAKGRAAALDFRKARRLSMGLLGGAPSVRERGGDGSGVILRLQFP